MWRNKMKDEGKDKKKHSQEEWLKLGDKLHKTLANAEYCSSSSSRQLEQVSENLEDAHLAQYLCEVLTCINLPSIEGKMYEPKTLLEGHTTTCLGLAKGIIRNLYGSRNSLLVWGSNALMDYTATTSEAKGKVASLAVLSAKIPGDLTRPNMPGFSPSGVTEGTVLRALRDVEKYIVNLDAEEQNKVRRVMRTVPVNVDTSSAVLTYSGARSEILVRKDAKDNYRQALGRLNRELGIRLW
jgi:hypothetical protein